MKNRTLAKSVLINLAILLTLGLSILLLIFSFFHFQPLEPLFTKYGAISRFVQRTVAVLLVVLAWNLYQRKRLAWGITLLVLTLHLFFQLFLRQGFFSTALLLGEAYILVILVIFQGYFSRRGRKTSVKKAVVIISLAAGVVLVNAVVEFMMLRNLGGQDKTFGESLAGTGAALLGITDYEGPNAVFEGFIFLFFWGCVVAGMLVIMHAATLNKAADENELRAARDLVCRYGQNPGSYLTLEPDKLLYFGKEVEGVVAYGTVADVIVVNGDPICAPENFAAFLKEFTQFCSRHGYECILLGATSVFLEDYKQQGFHFVKCGEEARFDLTQLSLAGGKVAKLRANINHANKAGLTTHEYKPMEMRDEEVERQMEAISQKWLEAKKSGELSFTVGGPGLENPMDRRYFYAANAEGEIAAFAVFLPFAGMQGYMADVTRRLPDAAGGVIEKLVYDGFAVFKEEGKQWGSMGLAPLSNVREEGKKDTATARLLDLIYEKFNGFYGFKDLRFAKEKYSPTSWEPGYFVYLSQSITPEMAYAVVKIQNPGGIGDFVTSYIKNMRTKKEEKADG